MTAVLILLLLVVLGAVRSDATQNAVECSNRARFTFASPRVVRMELLADVPGAMFEDRSSVMFAHRTTESTASTPLNVSTSTDWCNVSVMVHPFLRLSFRKGKRASRIHAYEISPPFDYFDQHSLTVSSEVLNFTWSAHMGQDDSGSNLLGTLAPTPSTDLAGCCTNPDASAGKFDPKFPLEQGVISLSGWSLIGNDDSPLIGEGFTGDFDQGWVVNRSITASVPYYDYHFFGCGREFAECLSEFVDVSGKMAVPTHHGLGVWWSRHWGDTFDGVPLGVMSEENIMKEVVNGYSDHGLPLDILVCDMEWHSQTQWPNCDEFLGIHGWSGYTWNRTLFPDPGAFISKLHDRGISLALNYHPDSDIDPCQDSYADMAKALGVDTRNNPLLPDLDPAQYNKTYVDAYFTYVMESSVKADIAWTDTPKATTWSNYLYTRYPALRKGKRTINFSRYGGVGDQRSPCGFSGDTLRKWDTLRYEVWMTPRASNIGFGWWSHDIGGFSGGYLPGSNHTESAELFLRWLQFATYAPIFRTHCRYCDQRIWTFGDDWFTPMKQTMLERRRLFPYINTHAHLETYQKGRSLLVPMYWDSPHGFDDIVYAPGPAADEQYKFGTDFVVAPCVEQVTGPKATVAKHVWLPHGKWFSWNAEEARNCVSAATASDIRDQNTKLLQGPMKLDLECGVGQMPVYVNASRIIPTRNSDVSSSESQGNSIIWVSFVPQEFNYRDGESTHFAEGRLLEDDGVSMDYHHSKRQLTNQNAASASMLTLATSVSNATATCVTIMGGKGSYRGMQTQRIHHFELRGVDPSRAQNATCRVNNSVNKGAIKASDNEQILVTVTCASVSVHASLEMCLVWKTTT